MRKSLVPFMQRVKPAPQTTLGGAKAYVQETAHTLSSSNAPMNVARIYSPPSMQHFDDSDPRYLGFSAQVENIYLKAVEPKRSETRSGFAQLLNWFTTGKME